jgi:hypothetical protein
MDAGLPVSRIARCILMPLYLVFHCWAYDGAKGRLDMKIMACPLSESWFYAPGNVHKIVNVTGGELSLLGIFSTTTPDVDGC